MHSKLKKTKKGSKHSSINSIKKSKLYNDVVTSCVTAKSGSGIASKANIGKIVKKVFPLVETDAKFNDICVYKHLKIMSSNHIAIH